MNYKITMDSNFTYSKKEYVNLFQNVYLCCGVLFI